MNFRAITEERIILAVDGFSKNDCFKLVNQVGESVYAVKIHDLYDRYGPGIVKELMSEGAVRVWVDAKLHDIPTTVGLRAKALSESGAGIITVHASGGVEMMEAAVAQAPRIYAVTVLTSLTGEFVERIYRGSVDDSALVLAREAKAAGVKGLVCSSKELPLFNSLPAYDNLELIVPGTRSEGANNNDQARVDTPANAIRNGATRLVFGRQITHADDPVAELEKLAGEIAAAKSASA